MFSVNFNQGKMNKKMDHFKAKARRASVCMLPLLPTAVMAQTGGGGLDAATSAMDDFRLWAYGALAIGCLIYMLYKVTMAFLEKNNWGDVFQGLGYCAIAGGIMVAADFMWKIWGDGGAI